MNTRLKLSTPVVLLECLNHLVESSMLPQLQCVLGIKPGHLHYWILVKVNIHFYSKPGLCESRSGHVPTFLKSFRSILERGHLAKSFCSRSSFLSFRSRSVPSRSVPFRSWRSYLKNGSIPLVPFLVKECFQPPVLFLV